MADGSPAPRPLFLGEPVPNFTADTQLGTLTLYDYVGQRWCILFSFPQDFTPVCATVCATPLEPVVARTHPARRP